jgi:hypothetical protein
MSSRTIVRPVRDVPPYYSTGRTGRTGCLLRLNFNEIKYSTRGTTRTGGTRGTGASSPAFFGNIGIKGFPNHRTHTAIATLHAIFHGELAQLI